MSIVEVEQALPNGLHDATISRIIIDYVGRTATIEVSVWVGDVAASSYAERERTRPGVLTLLGLRYFVIEPPDSRYPYAKPAPIKIDVSPVEASAVGGAYPLPSNLPAAVVPFRLFVSEWNAFIVIASDETGFAWLDEGANGTVNDGA